MYWFCDLSSHHLYTLFFFFNDTATTEIYTLSLHDALPISPCCSRCRPVTTRVRRCRCRDRKSTRLNSSHGYISYAVFCLKKKKQKNIYQHKQTTQIQKNSTLIITKLP